MNKLLNKARTFARLLGSGQGDALHGRMRYNWMLLRARISGQEPFIFRKAGVRYVCYPQDDESWVVCNLGVTDPVELAVLRRWLRPGDTAVDGGANLGIYAAALAQFVGSRGHVLAVDAGSRIVRQLERSAKLLGYPQIQCLHAALGDREGEVEFFEALPGQSSFGQSLRVEDNQAHTYRRQAVRMVTLNELAGRYLKAPPAVVKLDVEGAEGQALAGAPAAWLTSAGPLWIVEINPSALALFGVTQAQIVERFPPAAFEHWVLPKNLVNGGGSGPARLLTADESWDDSVYYNLLAIPRGDGWRPRRASIASLLNRA